MPTNRIVPCLVINDRTEEAVEFYTRIFKNSKVTDVVHYSEAGREMHRKTPGEVLMIMFELDGQPFSALNGGPSDGFNKAISFQVFCETQKEIDYFWEHLGEGGEYGPCSWLTDKFGVSWQIVPSVIPDLFKNHESPNAQRAMSAMMKMSKLDIAELKRAYAG